MKNSLIVIFSLFVSIAFAQRSNTTNSVGYHYVQHHSLNNKNYILGDGKNKLTFQIISTKQVSDTSYMITFHILASVNDMMDITFYSRDRIGRVTIGKNYDGSYSQNFENLIANEQCLDRIHLTNSIDKNYSIIVKMTKGWNNEFGIGIGGKYDGCYDYFSFDPVTCKFSLGEQSATNDYYVRN